MEGSQVEEREDEKSREKEDKGIPLAPQLWVSSFKLYP